MKGPLKNECVANAIKRNMETDGFKPGHRLPSYRELGKIYNAAGGTILKALESLEKVGLVERVPGSGVFVKHAVEKDNCQQLKPRKTVAESIADDIALKVSSGDYRIGNLLPSRKALKIEFRTTSTAVACAVKILTDRGLIARKGKSLRIGSGHGGALTRSKNKVMIFGNVDWVARTLISDQRDFFKTFEMELKKVGITIAYLDPGHDMARSIISIKADDLLGFLYADYETDDMGAAEAVKEFYRTKLPVVWYNHDILCPGIKTPGNVYTIRWDDFRAGEDMGTYLASLGHSRVAYFSCHKDEPWCAQRLNGLRSGLSAVAGANAVVEPRLELPPSISVAEASRKSRSKLKQYISEAFRNYTFTHIDPVTERPFGYEDEFGIPGVLFMIRNVIAKDTVRRVLEPHFKGILNRKDITAWVCSDETVAETAMEFLREEGVFPPHELSLAGIDASDKCMLYGITSYDFEQERLGYLAAHCLLGDIPVRRNRSGVVECPGSIIVRETTGRAKIQ